MRKGRLRKKIRLIAVGNLVGELGTPSAGQIIDISFGGYFIERSGKDCMEQGAEVALKYSQASPTDAMEKTMVVTIVISVVLGFVGLMAYMFYLTPGPNDRL